MKINYKKLLFYIIGTNFIGGLFAIFVNSSGAYKTLVKPPLSPPGILFPIVWVILYTLMGISLYLVSEANSIKDKTKAYTLYVAQLIVNSLWTLFYFGLNMRLFSFFWIVFLLVLVLLMIKEFLKHNKTAGYLQIPYVLWLIFASYLNLATYLLNR